MIRLVIGSIVSLLLVCAAGCGQKAKTDKVERDAAAAPAPAPTPPPPVAAKKAVPALPDPDGPDSPELNKQFEDACHGGNGEACYYIAVRINRGVGVGDTELSDYSRLAAPWYQKGCDAADAWSCEKLGTAYVLGDGVAADQAKALTLGEKACSIDATRCGFLAKFHFAGIGVTKDVARGGELLEKACAARSPDDCADLANRLMNGTDMTADPARAVKIATESCERNDRACWALGDFTLGGKGGITADEAKGKELRRSACMSGNHAGC